MSIVPNHRKGKLAMSTTQRVLVRVAFPLMIGLGLIAVALWLFGSVSAKGAASLPLVEIPAVSVPLSPLQAQNVVTIPVGKTSVTVDGVCREYSDGSASYTFTDVLGFTGRVYLKHDNANLYVCMEGAPGSFADRFARVYLDTDNGREAIAEGDDYALQVGILTPTLSSYKGTGAAGVYTPTLLSGWTAATVHSPNGESAEYSIPILLTGGGCNRNFGLSVFHHWLQGVGDDYGWPAGTIWDQPRTWQEVTLGSFPCGSGKIAYVYKNDTATAGDFKSLLEGEGFTVELIPLSAVTSTTFTSYNLIIIAHDTGYLNNWGTAAGQTTPIASAGKPVLGLGEGGYAFFGQLGSPIGWPNGWHGPLDKVYGYATSLPYYHTPYDFTGLIPGTFPIYNAPVDEVGIYLGGKPAPVVLPIGLEPPYPTGSLADHAPLIANTNQDQRGGCYQLWGYSGGPQQMNLSGSRLFVNAVAFGLGLTNQCTPPPQPTNCITLTKTAVPPNGTTVKPGDTITYTITYTVNPGCAIEKGDVMDRVPIDTLFVPGSASGGIRPNFDGTLMWGFVNLGSGTYSQTFQVKVMDTQCHNQRRVNNVAWIASTQGIVYSNLVSHPVNCPPVTFPNDQPPYAEDDIQIYPYPLVTGNTSQVSARVRNLLPTTQTVTVTFQTSPNRFGIGLDFADLTVPGNPKVVTLPPSGTLASIVIVKIDWTPVSSGHYCIQVKVEGTGFEPIYTQHNLDVAEDLRPGVEDVLTFTVGNPTAVTGTIQLVVDNTCPGWIAFVDPTSLADVGPNDTDLRLAALHVTPPVGPPLGTACHIDVQGWIGDKLIGGIRKLDVPPVHLPTANPPWEEKEISVNPDPPVVGQPVSFCVELANPLPISRTITVIYSYADFGAGIGFTPIQTRTITLPPGSIDKYCINWTPTAGGTLHRCLLVTLQQPSFQDQRSQHNVNLVRPTQGPSGIRIPFFVGNPDLFTRTLRFDPVLVGIDPTLWRPHFTPDPPPDLGPGQVLDMQFELVPAVAALRADAAASSNDYRFGDSSRAEIGVYLEDELVSGFTVEYGPPLTVYLPVVLRN
jgi:uncharacterized repeat protein (TIGR01451 family)